MSIETTNHNSNNTTNGSIAFLAHKLWDQAGKPTGRDLEFWVQAEKQVLGAERDGRAGEDRDRDILVPAAAETRAVGNGRSRNGSTRRGQKAQSAAKRLSARSR